jgi:hypothetical protein
MAQRSIHPKPLEAGPLFWKRSRPYASIAGLPKMVPDMLPVLERKSITHPEMYVPGIHLADGVSEPAERTTLRRVITGTFSSGLLMFPWTRVAGTSVAAAADAKATLYEPVTESASVVPKS